MSEKNKYEELLDQALQTMEFRLVRYPRSWGVEDIQDGNLGDIESRRFHSAEELFDLLEIYLEDYFVREVEELLPDSSGLCWDDLAEKARACLSPRELEFCGYDLDVLDMVCGHGGEIRLENCQYTNKKRGVRR